MFYKSNALLHTIVGYVELLENGVAKEGNRIHFYT